MRARTLETDYLVIGSGAAGMAFADSLIDETDAEIMMVDRRAAPGGHWNDAYPFVRLHQPSRYYGVNSTPLGSDTLELRGPESGQYERTKGSEIRAYYARVMEKRLIASGRVRHFPNCEYLGKHRFVSRLSGETFDVKVRRKLVDANYLAPAIPALTPAPFTVGDGVSAIPVHRLVDVAEKPARYVIVGAGKTALDACVWLLGNGVDPGDIQWVKPREAWLQNRKYTQPGELVGSLLEGISLQMEAAARANSMDDLVDRLEAAAQMRRVDRSVRPTMYKGATIGDWEIDLLRQIENVVRLGHVRSIERERILLEEGSVATSPQHLHVHCAAPGLRYAPAVPIFAAGRITLQPVRSGLVPFNAALVAFVEAHRDGDAEKNRLCPVNPFANTPLDWARGTLIQMGADRAWSKEADLQAWLERARLNPMRELRAHADEERVQQASRRFAANVGPGLQRLAAIVGQAAA
jgi:hypothetical protein